MTPSMYVASFAWILLALGVLLRKHREIHIRLMLGGIGLDLALVLYLQYTRRAVQKALAFDLTLLQQTHIGCSTVAVLLYLPTLYFGLKLIRAKSSVSAKDFGIIRAWHLRFAITAFVARTFGLLFMFSLWKNP